MAKDFSFDVIPPEAHVGVGPLTDGEGIVPGKFRIGWFNDQHQIVGIEFNSMQAEVIVATLQKFLTLQKEGS